MTPPGLRARLQNSSLFSVLNTSVSMSLACKALMLANGSQHIECSESLANPGQLQDRGQKLVCSGQWVEYR